MSDLTLFRGTLFQILKSVFKSELLQNTFFFSLPKALQAVFYSNFLYRWTKRPGNNVALLCYITLDISDRTNLRETIASRSAWKTRSLEPVCTHLIHPEAISSTAEDVETRRLSTASLAVWLRVTKLQRVLQKMQNILLPGKRGTVSSCAPLLVLGPPCNNDYTVRYRHALCRGKGTMKLQSRLWGTSVVWSGLNGPLPDSVN